MVASQAGSNPTLSASCHEKLTVTRAFCAARASLAASLDSACKMNKAVWATLTQNWVRNRG